MDPVLVLSVLIGLALVLLIVRRRVGRQGTSANQVAAPNAAGDSTDLIGWADDLVGEYADLLEQSNTDLLLPESALPASRDDVKRALVITAVTKLRLGLITEKEIDVYRTGYMLLMNFVPDDQARRAKETTDRVRALRQSAREDPRLLQPALEAFSENADVLGNRDTVSQGAALVGEFDSRLAKLRAGAPLGAA